MPDDILLKTYKEQVCVLTFNHEKPQNPFSDALQDALTDALEEAAKREDIRAVVFYGGNNRSFSVGGDFKEAIELGDPGVIAAALNKVVDLYIAVLKLNKPLIAAIDHYAIGMGFQIALLADYRVATERTTFLMPELKNGVACTLGGLMTEFILGRFIMQDICYGNNKIALADALQWKLINELAAPEELLQKAIAKAAVYGAYPQRAFRGTKQVNNRRFIAAVEACRQDTVDVHTAVFLNKEHQSHMSAVLSKNKP